MRKIIVALASATTAAIVVACPLAATAQPDLARSRASAAGAAGTVYGGTSSQRFPVVIETSRNGRKVLNATIAIRLNCRSGGGFTVPDNYGGMPVKNKRKFSASFGPETRRNDDGTTTDFEGSLTGAFNKARSKASGTWSFKATEHDGSGAVTDTCESGSVRWTAKQ
jgi:hypothetical protein